MYSRSASTERGTPADGARLPLEYVLPLRWTSCAGDDEMTAYLERLARWADVTVVDGSPREVFAEHARRWGGSVRHIAPIGRSYSNGKVAGVLTGFAISRHDRIVAADDDVRYTFEGLQRMTALLKHFDLVRPQNYFRILPWHARWDTARSLINRALGSDFPGTLGVRASAVAAGYRGDVLFENLELIRTITAAGGSEFRADDLFVERLPPTARHFLGQRVRQAYDSQAQPVRLAIELALLPGIVAQAHRPVGYLGWAVAAIGVAVVGRQRHRGAEVFTASAPLWAPLWVAERAITAWLALGRRATGGVPYAGGKIVHAASSVRQLRRAAVKSPQRE